MVVKLLRWAFDASLRLAKYIVARRVAECEDRVGVACARLRETIDFAVELALRDALGAEAQLAALDEFVKRPLLVPVRVDLRREKVSPRCRQRANETYVVDVARVTFAIR